MTAGSEHRAPISRAFAQVAARIESREHERNDVHVHTASSGGRLSGRSPLASASLTASHQRDVGDDDDQDKDEINGDHSRYAR
jgi:hypothetical protein